MGCSPKRPCISKTPSSGFPSNVIYFPVAFLTQPPVPFRMSLISMAFVTDGICGIHRRKAFFEVLKRIAGHEMPLYKAENWLDHLTSCSPCYTDFCEFQAAHRS